jgi:preprotein translocase subunit SecA
VIRGGYPEREEPREGALDRLLAGAEYYAGKLPGLRRPLGRIVDVVHARERELEGEDLAGIAARAVSLRPRLRREGFTEQLTGEAFSLVRAAAGLTVGMRHFDVQLVGGWAMLNGMLAEMETGEGKTLTATLAAATAGLAGHAVHVITVNDYLASRDAEVMRPVYEALGLTIACVVHGLDPQERRKRYGCDIAYCSNKELTFDYLRDRMTLGGRPRPIGDKIDALAGGKRSEGLLLRGLQFALVDEADSVLIDEARTPLILSAPAKGSDEEALYRQALELARGLSPADYLIEDGQVELTAAGEEALAAAALPLGGLWNGPRRRERLAKQALSALHLFEVDKHYLVRDGKVQIIDENTGRLMPDRSWEQGLHQLIELKEGVEVTGQRETLARISYQRFFRRYLHIGGMTGTGAEVARELWSVYRLRVSRIPTNRPVQRVYAPERVFANAEDKWTAVLEAIRRRHATGQPVLVGTRSVAASEHLAKLLDEAGLEYQLLNARQDENEAQIVAQAGQAGRITVATNMAGRGTDIKLPPGVKELGGLHVICTERHDSGRIDRQLYGRCGRQGDPGSCETFVSVADELVANHLKPAGSLAPPQWLGRTLIALAQWRAERAHSQVRRDLLAMEDQMGDQLAFSGRGE